ncbi:MAG: response regulator transcription factor [Bacteroidales bacterium]|nr:response regulator transcription factor [Bacteroidales bacterium]MBK7175420.1 response regulator transcription factor [Bacteroidales bacterium]
MEIKVGIVEDHAEFRQSLGFLISSFTDYKVSWACSSVEEALNMQSVDVLLLDINLPGKSGLEAISLFKAKSYDQKIIMLTILEDEYHILTAIKSGADGYILKKTPPAKILEAILNVYEGGAALTPMVARLVLSSFNPGPRNPGQSELTPREKEILGLITEGMSTERIAEKLFISQQTVRNHIKNIYEKLQVHSKAQAVAKALKEKLV